MAAASEVWDRQEEQGRVSHFLFLPSSALEAERGVDLGRGNTENAALGNLRMKKSESDRKDISALSMGMGEGRALDRGSR